MDEDTLTQYVPVLHVRLLIHFTDRSFKTRFQVTSGSPQRMEQPRVVRRCTRGGVVSHLQKEIQKETPFRDQLDSLAMA